MSRVLTAAFVYRAPMYLIPLLAFGMFTIVSQQKAALAVGGIGVKSSLQSDYMRTRKRNRILRAVAHSADQAVQNEVPRRTKGVSYVPWGTYTSAIDSGAKGQHFSGIVFCRLGSS
jgi:hypothetical protein